MTQIFEDPIKLLLISLILLVFQKSNLSQWSIEDTLYNGDGFFQFVSTVDSSIVWAAGSSWSTGEKLLYRRSPTGIWSSIPLNGIPGNQQITCLSGINSQTAIIGVGQGNASLYRTTNAGIAWQIVANTGGTNGYFNDVRFSRIHPAYGYAWSDPPLGIGNPFKIFKTSNYGQNWIEFNFLYNSNYIGASPSICVTDSNHAWFGLNKNLGGSDYGKILFTSNGGISFSVISIPLLGNFVNSVEFNSNNMLGYASVSEQSAYYAKTTNFGINWVTINPGFTISSCKRIISIPNSDTWYALNTATSIDNRIYRSTNAGQVWLPMQLPGGQYDVKFMDAVRENNYSYVYAVTTLGYVLRLRDSITLVGISSNNSAIPTNFELQQNYPNPFNSQTVIEYSVFRKGLVSITLHDVLGRKIMNIEGSVKNPGHYSVQLDCGNLTSGVYFYKMYASDFTDVKKLIIIK